MPPLSRTLHWFILSTGLLVSFHAIGDTVYCADNKQMHCLGFDEKIVARNAVCFDSLKCSQEGFVCKSELDVLSDEYENLLGKYNELVDTHNQLINAHEANQSTYEHFRRCVATASTLEEAKDCD